MGGTIKKQLAIVQGNLCNEGQVSFGSWCTNYLLLIHLKVGNIRFHIRCVMGGPSKDRLLDHGHLLG